MSSLVLSVLGTAIVAMAVWGLISGKVISGARGLHANYYHRSESPLLYYGFILVYLAIGTFCLYNAMSNQ